MNEASKAPAGIVPTVGRKVWFYEDNQQAEPHVATVIKVWGSSPYAAVNLDVVDPYSGGRQLRTSVVVGDETTKHPHYRWMPYQQGQAAKQAAEAPKTLAVERIEPSADAERRIALIAKVCHEANRAYCIAIGDTAATPWDIAPESQRQSCIAGVKAKLANPHMTPKEQHDAWLIHKVREGWTYGPEKSEAEKKHPCLVPYADLPEQQRTKDYLFGAIVNAMAEFEVIA